MTASKKRQSQPWHSHPHLYSLKARRFCQHFLSCTVINATYDWKGLMSWRYKSRESLDNWLFVDNPLTFPYNLLRPIKAAQQAFHCTSQCPIDDSDNVHVYNCQSATYPFKLEMNHLLRRTNARTFRKIIFFLLGAFDDSSTSTQKPLRSPDARLLREMVQKCAQCQKFNISKHGFHPLSSISGTLPLYHVAIDLIGPFAIASDEFNCVFLMVDVCTRFVWLRPFIDKTVISTARCLSDIFVDFGFPTILRSGDGTDFVNQIVKTFSSPRESITD